MPVRLAITDGHTLIRYGLRELLAKEPDIEVVAECESGAEASKAAATAEIDVITLGVSLPDADGLRLAGRLRKHHPGLGIVILTSQDEDAVLFRAAESGASAFVAKTAAISEVVAAVRHAAVAADSFSAAGLAAALGRRRRTHERLALSPRESQVLRLLRDGMSVPAIAMAMLISQSTAKTYVARLYDKLSATNRAQALMTALRHGLISYEDEPTDDEPTRLAS